MTTTTDAELAERMGNTPEVVAESIGAYGSSTEGRRVAHRGARLDCVVEHIFDEHVRNDPDAPKYSANATLVTGAGNRAIPEAPDELRTCFERDGDRIRYSPAFRRLAHKCQVFIAPTDDHLRTRLTHALEVAQVAVAVARALGLNTALTEAIALGHDCGHGPAGHASEEAFAAHLSGGYDHATWGAHVVLGGLNLCAETIDGIASHSWRLSAPSTPEAEIVAWADRIAYVCHDFDDAVRAGVVNITDLDPGVAEVAGVTQSQQIGSFTAALVRSTADAGYICMDDTHADALDAFRRTNYDRIYLRDAARAQAEKVIALLGSLVEFHTERVQHIPDLEGRLGARFDVSEVTAGSEAARFAAVHYVSSMTDRYALTQGVELLGVSVSALPQGA